MVCAATGTQQESRNHWWNDSGSGLVIQLIESVSGLSQLESHGDISFYDFGLIFDHTSDGGSTCQRYLIPWSNVKAIVQHV